MTPGQVPNKKENHLELPVWRRHPEHRHWCGWSEKEREEFKAVLLWLEITRCPWTRWRRDGGGLNCHDLNEHSIGFSSSYIYWRMCYFYTICAWCHWMQTGQQHGTHQEDFKPWPDAKPLATAIQLLSYTTCLVHGGFLHPSNIC